MIAVLGLSACRGGPKPIVSPPVPSSNAVRQLQHDIDTLLADPVLDRGSWGVVVKSLMRGDTLYSLNARKLLMPASTMKIATLAVAADRLGWDYTYETRLTRSGTVHDDMLDGDLVIVGSGDPSIDDWGGDATRLFQTWAGELKTLGIHTITGRIVGDDRAFADEPFGVGWAWDDLDNSYGTAVGALQFNENTARVLVDPARTAGEPAAVSIQQAGNGLTVRNSVATVTEGAAASITTRRLAGSSLLDIRGSVPAFPGGAHPVAVNVSVVNSTIYFVTALRDALIAADIEVRGAAVDIDDIVDAPQAEGSLLLSHRSPPLRDLAVTMMKNSQNLFAETLLRTLGGRPATFNAARVAEESVLLGWGIGSTDIVIADGSGLSRNDLITPEATLAILTHMDHDERSREPFEGSLPIAGLDGTLAQRMKGTAAERNVRAKTGSFSNARAIAGYASSADGEPLVFSIVANNFGIPADEVEKTEDAIVVRLAQFSRR